MATQLDRIKRDINELANPDADAAQAAEMRLVEWGTKALKPLTEAASNENAAVRARAVWALGKIGDPGVFDTLVALLKDEDADVKYDAAMALGDLGDERAVEPLVELVRSASSEDVASSAAGNALAEIGDASVRPLIGVMLTGSPDAKVVAAYTLGRLASTEAIEPMAELLNDPNEWVRLSAIESLGRMGESLPTVLAIWCCELIEQCIKDPVERVREGAIYWRDNLHQQIGPSRR